MVFFLNPEDLKYIGGSGEIRTHAGFKPPSCLVDSPLKPLEYTSILLLVGTTFTACVGNVRPMISKKQESSAFRQRWFNAD